MPIFAPIFRQALTLTFLVHSVLAFGKADALTWNISGPGITQIIQEEGAVTFNYELDVRSTYGVFVWNISGGMLEPGPFAFDWFYSGNHNFGQTHTQFGIDSDLLIQPLAANAPRSSQFSYSGRVSSTALSYSKLHLWVRGANDDRTDFLKGTLTLRAVPLPPSLLMMAAALGLTGLAFANRRKTLQSIGSGENAART